MTDAVFDTHRQIALHFGLSAERWFDPAVRQPIEIPNTSRDDLPGLFHACDMITGAEIGVEQGAYAEILCKNNLGVHLFCVDAWTAYRGYRDHVTQSKLDGFYDKTAARLKIYRATLIRKFSVDAAKDFEDSALDFVYIDANHDFFSVVDDLRAWIPKVRKGGIIAGHDYCQRKQSGYQVHVVEAVHGYTGAYFVRPWFVLGSKTAANGETRDRPRSFFWVKS